MKRKSHRLVVCGTDTDVGKTVMSALLVQGLGASYWKPIQSGLENGGDTYQVRELIRLPANRCIKEAYQLKTPVSPHWAAEKESKLIDPSRIYLPEVNGNLIIETAGGLLVPLNRNYLQIELLKDWGIPVILVVRSGLGTLNHTLLSIEALKNRNIPILGLIVNGPPHPDNPRTLQEIGGVEVIAEVPKMLKVNAKSLANVWQGQNLETTFKRLLI